MVKIRLRRIGKKKAPFYRIVVADSRTSMQGSTVAEIGTYDPLKEPAEVKINEEENKALITMDSSQVSLAVGKNGSNIRLAELMIGMDIEIFRDVQGADDDDVLLSSFNDEIDQWVIDALRKVGFDTAKDVLRMSNEDIMERADLDLETVEEVKKILQAEFEDPMEE